MKTTKGDGFDVTSLRSRTGVTIGGAPGAAKTLRVITKSKTGLTDTTATDVFTVTVPNAQHTAVIEVDALGVMGAGGAVGAGETSRASKYQVVVARTAGLAAVIAVSAAIGGAQAKVAGADNITSVVVTASAVAGGNTVAQTFTIKVAITKAAGAADNHTLVASARVLNQQASGITIA